MYLSLRLSPFIQLQYEADQDEIVDILVDALTKFTEESASGSKQHPGSRGKYAYLPAFLSYYLELISAVSEGKDAKKIDNAALLWTYPETILASLFFDNDKEGVGIKEHVKRAFVLSQKLGLNLMEIVLKSCNTDIQDEKQLRPRLLTKDIASRLVELERLYPGLLENGKGGSQPRPPVFTALVCAIRVPGQSAEELVKNAINYHALGLKLLDTYRDEKGKVRSLYIWIKARAQRMVKLLLATCTDATTEILRALSWAAFCPLEKLSLDALQLCVDLSSLLNVQPRLSLDHVRFLLGHQDIAKVRYRKGFLSFVSFLITPIVIGPSRARDDDKRTARDPKEDAEFLPLHASRCVGFCPQKLFSRRD